MASTSSPNQLHYKPPVGSSAELTCQYVSLCSWLLPVREESRNALTVQAVAALEGNAKGAASQPGPPGAAARPPRPLAAARGGHALGAHPLGAADDVGSNPFLQSAPGDETATNPFLQVRRHPGWGTWDKAPICPRAACAFMPPQLLPEEAGLQGCVMAVQVRLSFYEYAAMYLLHACRHQRRASRQRPRRQRRRQPCRSAGTPARCRSDWACGGTWGLAPGPCKGTPSRRPPATPSCRPPSPRVRKDPRSDKRSEALCLGHVGGRQVWWQHQLVQKVM